MFDSLAYLLDRMMEKGRYVSIFFRNDDVGRRDASLARMIDLFAARGVPLNLAVVPAWIDVGEAHCLIDYKKLWPGLLCYHQHGYRHVNHAREGKRSEFPKNRPYENQLGDLRAGKEILTAKLGEAFFPAFTPPWNRCSTATLDALAALGFRVVSRDAPTPGAAERGLVDMPVTLDILQRAPGEGWRCREPQDFVADLIKQLGFLNYVGIMLHHQHMGEECLGFLEMLMAMIVGHPVLRIVSFEQLDKLSGN